MPADQEKGDRDVGADAVLGCFLRLANIWVNGCLLYTSPSPRDVEESRMPSSA